MRRGLPALLALTLWIGAAPGAQGEPKPEAVLRAEGSLSGMRLNKAQTMLAFTDHAGQSLRIMDLKTQEIVEVTPYTVGNAFFWSPDGNRLFYRALVRDSNAITSEFGAYDTKNNKDAILDTFNGSSGFLTFDPRDYSVLMMNEKGIVNRRLDFPGERFSRYQQRQKVNEGRFVVTQRAVLWLTDLGLTLSTLKDDDSGIESFDVSPDGRTIAWATNQDRIYISKLGEEPKVIGRGRDPRWHPYKALLLYSGARMVGSKAYDYDIRITDLEGRGRYLTHTPAEAERWPQWWGDSAVIYTKPGSTDLWRLPYKEAPIAQTSPRETTKQQ